MRNTFPQKQLSARFQGVVQTTLTLGTRRVFVTPSTFKPDEAWIVTQAQAFLDHVAAEGFECKTIMRDLDGKYSKAFDKVFADQRVEVKKVGPRAPNLNAFIERGY